MIYEKAIIEGKQSNAEQFYTESLRIKSFHCPFSDLVVLMMRLSKLNREMGNYEKSIELYEKCLLHRKICKGDHDDLTSELYLHLGTIFESSNRPKKALVCYDKSVRSSSDNIEALLKKVELLLKFGHDAEATHCLKQNHSFENNAIALYFQGKICERSNNTEEATYYYNRAFSICGSEKKHLDVKTKLLRDKAKLLLKGCCFEDAKDCISKALTSCEGFMKAQLMVLEGQVLEAESNNLDEALLRYEGASQILSSIVLTKMIDSFERRDYFKVFAKTNFLMGCIQGNVLNLRRNSV